MRVVVPSMGDDAPLTGKSLIFRRRIYKARLGVGWGMVKSTAFQKNASLILQKACNLPDTARVSEQSDDLTPPLFHSHHPPFSSPSLPQQRNLTDSLLKFSACNFSPLHSRNSHLSPENCLLEAKHGRTRQQGPKGKKEKDSPPTHCTKPPHKQWCWPPGC